MRLKCMAEILITGGTGLLGKTLCRKLSALGKDFAVLSRSGKAGTYKAFEWDPETGVFDDAALEGLKTVIHLAGAGIADERWTRDRKEYIIRSRTFTSAFLLEQCKRKGIFPETFISASGINFYGINPSAKIFTEDDGNGEDFTANVVRLWEQAADEWTGNARVVKLRIGVVLAAGGGALHKMIPVFRMGLGAPLGTGKQWMPWIHIDDIAEMMIFALENPKVKGVYNAVASQHVTNREFTKYFAKALNRKAWLPNVPAFILKLMFGKLSELVLKGNRADNSKIKAAGFTFRYERMDDALNKLFQK